MAATARAVDMTNVKEGGNFRPRRKPEGDYKAKIVKADDHHSAEAKKKGDPPGWVLTIQVEGDARSTYPYYLSPTEKQAWKIGAVCRAVGLRVPKGRMRFDPNKLVNRTLGVALVDDEYEGRVKSTIDDVFPASEVGPNADEDVPEDEIDTGDEEEVDDEEEVEDEPEETPPPRKRTARKPTPPPVDEDEADDEEEQEEEEEPPPPPRKRVRKAAPPPPPEDDEEEEDEDEEPAPPPRRRRTTPPPAKKTATRRKAAPPPEEDDDDLDDLETDDLD